MLGTREMEVVPVKAAAAQIQGLSFLWGSESLPKCQFSFFLLHSLSD